MHLLSTLAALSCGSLALAANSDAVRVEDPQIQTLISQLDHDDYKAREQATIELWGMGDQAMQLLLAAQNSDAPEIARRADFLVKNIQLNLTSTSDPKIIEQVRLYSQASSSSSGEKSISSLADMTAYEQIIKIFHHETNLARKAKLEKLINKEGITKLAVKKALRSTGVHEAIEITRKAPRSYSTSKILAHLLHQANQLDAELAAIKQLPLTPQNIETQLAILQVKGNFAAIKEFATKHDHSATLKTIAILDGNTEPLLDYIRGLYDKPKQHDALNFILDDYEKSSLVDIKAFVKESVEGAADLSIASNFNFLVNTAMLLGDQELGEDLIVTSPNGKTAAYFLSIGKPDQALSLIGAPSMSDSPEAFELWLKVQIELELNQEDPSKNFDNPGKIQQLAEFYINRGESKTASRIITPLLDRLVTEDKSLWHDKLAWMMESGLSQDVVKLALKQDDIDTYKSLTYYLFEHQSSVDSLWSAIEGMYPFADASFQFKQLMSLMGVTHASAEPTRSLEILIYKGLDEPADRTTLIEVLAFAAEKRGDLHAMLKFTKELCALDKEINVNHLGRYRFAALSLMDWPEVINAIRLGNPKSHSANFFNSVHYAIAQYGVGNTEKGDKALEEVIIKTQGNSRQLNKIGAYLNTYGYTKEATKIWRSVVQSSAEINWQYVTAVSYLSETAKQNPEITDFKQVKAYSLVDLALILRQTSSDYAPITYLHFGFNHALFAGMEALHHGDAKQGIRLLESAHSTHVSHGILGDQFFPMTRKLPELSKLHKRWFSDSWKAINTELVDYPNSHNTRNSLAWIGSRSGLKLNESLVQAEMALKLKPNEPAYLDTLGETYFAMGNRKLAISSSDKALESIAAGVRSYEIPLGNRIYLYSNLTTQNKRFEFEKFQSNAK